MSVSLALDNVVLLDNVLPSPDAQLDGEDLYVVAKGATPNSTKAAAPLLCMEEL